MLNKQFLSFLSSDIKIIIWTIKIFRQLYCVWSFRNDNEREINIFFVSESFYRLIRYLLYETPRMINAQGKLSHLFI